MLMSPVTRVGALLLHPDEVAALARRRDLPAVLDRHVPLGPDQADAGKLHAVHPHADNGRLRKRVRRYMGRSRGRAKDSVRVRRPASPRGGREVTGLGHVCP
ncbi:hypothetical protein AB0469_40275 [Streptomyces sp. NPDC093801]|uniref:hypothetical protein n=1 Tax=Streptomyces sp. NPDC093801 TaxID=3155203 RepID=UPI00344C5E6E